MIDNSSQDGVSQVDTTNTTSSNQKVNVEMAVIAYVFFLIPLLTESKDDPFVKFHLKQAITLVIFSVSAWIVSSVVPVIGWFIIGPVTSLLFLVFWVMGVVNAINKQQKELPLIGKYAEQLLKF